MRAILGFLIFILSSGAVIPAAAQPAPPPPECPAGEVYSSQLGACVPPDQLPPAPTPVDTGESSLPDPEEPGTQEEVEDAMANGDIGALNSFTIQHFACGTGFDPAANAGRWTALRTNCTGDGTPAFAYTISEEGVTLATPTLTSGGGAWGEQRYVSDMEQDFLIHGRLSVNVQAPGGWYLAFVTCQTTRSGANLGTFTPPVSNNVAFIDEGRIGSDLGCAFFLAQTGADGPGGGQATGGEAAVTLTVRNCPDGTTAASDLATTCTGTDNRVTFHIQTETETINSRTTDTTGVATLTVPGDTEVAVTEDLPSGYGQPIVVCAGESQDILFGSQIRITVPAGTILSCQWYDIPTDGPDNGPSIFIRPVDCGPATTPSEILEQAQAACTASLANVTFDVSLDGVLVADDVVPTGPDALVFLTRLPVSEFGSEFIITANLPRGSISLRAFCDRGKEASGFDVIDPQLRGTTIAAWADPGQTLRCTWFFRTAGSGAQPPEDQAAPDTPGEEPGIVVRSRLCPPEVETARVDWNVVCTEPGAGITATLMRDGTVFLSLQTGIDGTLPMPPDPPAGTYALTASTSPGMLGPQIDCVIRNADGTTTSSSAYLPEEPAGAAFPWDGTQHVSCTVWYVVQDPPNARSGGAGQGLVASDGDDDGAPVVDASSLTLQIWLCLGGVDATATQEDLLAACATDLESRAITVTVDGVSSEELISGNATWTASDGAFVVDLGPNAPQGAVWCSATWVTDGAEDGEFPSAVALDGGALAYTAAQPSSTIYCDWFLAMT